MLRNQLTDRDLHTLRVDGPLTQFVVQHSIYHIYLLLVIKKNPSTNATNYFEKISYKEN